MEWEKLFEKQVLKRGHDYYYNNAVENMDVSDDTITADVIGSDDYEVEISLNNGEVTDMYCSCPYAEDGKNCKHMAAVLYEWSEECANVVKKDETDDKDYLFEPAHTVNAKNKKRDAVEKLVAGADDKVVRSFLIDVLVSNEKQLYSFNNIINKKTAKGDVKSCMKQVDAIMRHYLGRKNFISYDETDDFISEIEEIIDEDVCGMMDKCDYMDAFELMNYIFVKIGNVPMDDSDGGTMAVADTIYDLWDELLEEVKPDEKREMFKWFVAHTDGLVVDYLTDYIEEIIVEEFEEEEYQQPKREFVEHMIEMAKKKDLAWGSDYNVGKWVIRYIEMLEENKAYDEIEDICRKYWKISDVREFYIDMCTQKKEYDKVIKILDECINLDKGIDWKIAEHIKKKKEIYRLQGNKDAYIKQLWKLELEYKKGDLEIFKELKSQYTPEEWLVKREEIFSKLSIFYHIDRLYNEEELYDRLLEYVLECPGLYAVQQYESVLKKDYSEQILKKYYDEINKMASKPNTRKYYSELVTLLKGMKKIKGGTKVVESIVDDWRVKYKKRPAMMEELGKL